MVLLVPGMIRGDSVHDVRGRRALVNYLICFFFEFLKLARLVEVIIEAIDWQSLLTLEKFLFRIRQRLICVCSSFSLDPFQFLSNFFFLYLFLLQLFVLL